MPQLISFMIEDDQLIALKRASMNENVGWEEEVQRVFARGLLATAGELNAESVSSRTSVGDGAAKPGIQPGKDPFNVDAFMAVVDSNIFRERFAKVILKPRM